MPKVSVQYLENRRQQILDAASECFAARGFHCTTMQDIVRQSGLSPGAIYTYFRSKEEIIEAITDARHEREKALIVDALDTRHLSESITLLRDAFLGELRDPASRERRRLGVEIWAEALRNPVIHRLVREGIDEPLKLFTRLISRAQRRGEFPAELDPEGFGRVMIALFQGFVLQLSWDEELELEPYLSVINWWLNQLRRE